MSRVLTDDEITRQLADLSGWERAGDEIKATYTFDDFVGALAFVNRVGEVAEELQHHPDIDIRWNEVTLALTDHEAGGLSQTDIEAAHRISALS